MTSENGCLRKALQDAEEKLQILENTVVSETSTLSQSDNETTTTKIILLSKMCKDQAMELEALKSKCKMLDEKLVVTESLQLNYTKFKNNDSIADLICTSQDGLDKNIKLRCLNYTEKNIC